MTIKRSIVLLCFSILLLLTPAHAESSVISEAKNSSIDFSNGEYAEKLREFRIQVTEFLYENSIVIIYVGAVLVIISGIVGIFIKVFRSYAFLLAIGTIILYILVKVGLPALTLLE